MKTQERKFAPKDALTLMRQGAPALLARLWAARGVTGIPSGSFEERIIPYDQLKGAMEAADFLCDCVVKQRRVVVVADYDADGATACSVMVRALRAFGANVGYLIPKRLEHGYGLTPDIVEVAAQLEPKPDVLLTVDNGISSHYGIDRAHELGMEVVVTDHHLAPETLPRAEIIVNPNQPGCPFPSKSLAGCGVAWYVMWALHDRLFEEGVEFANPKFDVKHLLPIVAVGTIADVVQLDANNRLLVAEGLKRIRNGEAYPGLRALAAEAGASCEVLSTTDIAFGIGPQINAAGRLSSMDAGVECLVTDDEEVAKMLASNLREINQERKAVEGKTTAEAVRQLLMAAPEKSRTVVLHDPQWHQGVIGIVAGRIKEALYRPTFVLADGNPGEVKGSGRSIPGFHLRDALDVVDKRYPGVLLKFGGHAMAAGVTVRAGAVDEFRNAFEAVAAEMLNDEDMNQVLVHDGGLEVGELSLQTVNALRMQVWGQGFPEPTFMDRFTVLEAKPMGDGKHLRMLLSKNGRRFSAVRFRYEGPLPSGEISMLYKLSANSFRGETSLQLLAETFEVAA